MTDNDLPLSLVIDLDPPIEVNGQSHDAIELHEPNASQILKAQAELRGGVNAESITRYNLTLITQVSGKPRLLIEKLPISKLNEASEFLTDFLAKGLRAGST